MISSFPGLPSNIPELKMSQLIQVPVYEALTKTNEKPFQDLCLYRRPLIYTEECVAAGAREDLL
ncbi:MAG: hypothetical protein EOP48_23195 [Sphingobacteriales bacterium]|nr:MAG: hypothetical protein EOP48_23195 [Sphingobacteriales bacterium]